MKSDLLFIRWSTVLTIEHVRELRSFSSYAECSSPLAFSHNRDYTYKRGNTIQCDRLKQKPKAETAQESYEWLLAWYSLSITFLPLSPVHHCHLCQPHGSVKGTGAPRFDCSCPGHIPSWPDTLVLQWSEPADAAGFPLVPCEEEQ